MDQVWSWITTLSSSSSSPSSLLLIASADKSILLRAETTAQELITFSISLMGFGPSKTLWASSAFPLSSLTPCHFLTQLVQEIITLSPTSSILPHDNSGPRLDVGPISYAINKTQESARFLFMLVLTCRLFWLCAVDAPAEAGFLFFRSVGPQSLGQALDCRPALRGVLTAVGPDWEERFMRSLGYVITKWCVLQELQQKPTAPMVPRLCPCYATSAHGLWILKGYAPTSAMTRICSGAVTAGRRLAIKDSALQYALAHQQLEAVIQMEYKVTMNDPRYIRVSTRVDNIRLHVVRLGLGKGGDDDDERDHLRAERHFPSRIRVWVGPEIGSSYTTGLSLGRSTYNPERESETTQTIKGNSATPKFPTLKARARTSVRSRWKSWRWEQEAEGSAAVFEGVLYDGMTGAEVAAAGGRGMRGRYTGVGRGFSKGGGLVVAGDEMGEGVSWRVGREMEGRVLKWRIGGRIWVSYCPNEVKSECFESRVVEWRDEVDLPLVASCD